MTKSCDVWRTWAMTVNFLNFYFKFIAMFRFAIVFGVINKTNDFEVLIFSGFFFSNCFNWKINCDDHSSLWSTTAVQIFNNYSMSLRWIWSDKITNERVRRVGYNRFISNKGEWNNCFSKFSNRVLPPIFISTILQSENFLTWRTIFHMT